MAASQMPDNASFNAYFVGIIEKYPAIYDLTCAAYSNRNETEKAWFEIASQVHCSADQCKLRWKHIRNSFLRHLRSNVPSGSDAGARKRPYYLHEQLAFLIPFTKPRKQSSNLDFQGVNEIEIGYTPIIEDANEESISFNDTYVETPPDTLLAMQTGGPETSHADILSQDSASETVASPRLSYKRLLEETPRSEVKKKMKKGADIEEVAKHYFSMRAGEHSDNDGLMGFFKSLVPDVRKLPPKMQRECKMRILGVVNEMLDACE